MYKRTFWIDHVTDQNGDVIQQGTLQDQSHFNNIELGIFDAYVAAQITVQFQLQKQREYDGRLDGLEAECFNEVGTITLTNSDKYPFNNSLKTVALQKARKTLNYDVDIEVTAATGSVGDVVVSDKQLNGFKVAFDGSAKSVIIKYRVKGGLLV